MIYIDLHDVLCDLANSFLYRAGSRLRDTDMQHLRIWEYVDMSPHQYRLFLKSLGPIFWAELPRHPWSHRLIAACLDRMPTAVVMSLPDDDPFAWSGSAQWISRNLRGLPLDVVVTSRKHLLARPCTVLIDDREGNCKMFRAAGGQAILFPRPWNRDRDVVGPAVDHVIHELGKLSLVQPYQ